jgi:pimeloyl-ACP methyl ester carboxylesterase
MVEDLIQAYCYASQAGYKISFVCSSFGASIFLLAQAKFHFQPTRIVLLNPVTDYLTNFVMADTEWGRRFSPQLQAPDFWLLAKHKIPNNRLRLGRTFISELALLEPQAITLSSDQRALVLHGDADVVISQASAKRFVEKHDFKAVSFVSIPGAEHAFPGHQKTIFDLICKFLCNE